MWKFICLLACVFVIETNGYRKKPCEIVNFDYRNFEKENFIEGRFTRPFHLTYSEKSNTLMFHEDTESLKKTETYIINLKTNEVTDLKSLDHAVGSIVDDNGNYIIATNNGLYNYNPLTKVLNAEILRHISFYNIYKFNGQIYFVDYPKKDLYVMENYVPKLLIGDKNIEAFAVDSAENFYYGNSTGLYYGNFKVGTVDYIADSNEIPYDGLMVNPGNEIVFVFSHYGVFKINRDSGTLKRISTKAMLYLVFDKNRDMIYSDEEHIVKLKLTNKTC